MNLALNALVGDGLPLVEDALLLLAVAVAVDNLLIFREQVLELELELELEMEQKMEMVIDVGIM